MIKLSSYDRAYRSQCPVTLIYRTDSMKIVPLSQILMYALEPELIASLLVYVIMVQTPDPIRYSCSVDNQHPEESANPMSTIVAQNSSSPKRKTEYE